MCRKVVFEATADHHLDEIGGIEIGHGPGRDMPAVAHHRDGIAQAEDFFHPMAHIDRGDAVGAQPPNQVVELFRFVLRQAARGLVKDDDPGAAADSNRNLQHLLLTGREIAHLAPHIE